MSCIAIIPARGGSKRIPRKNIKNFLGQPIISYSIKAALQSKLFEEVMVSTEDEEIAEIARKNGAQIPFLRSKKNASDVASTLAVIFEVLEEYEKRGQHFKYACCIYPTAPFVSAQKLIEAQAQLLSHQLDCVFPVLKFSAPIQRALKIENQKISMFQPENMGTRSQDLQTAYHDSGQFYFFEVNSIRHKKKLWTDNTGAIILSDMEAHDIDNEEDWKIAEFKYRVHFHEQK